MQCAMTPAREGNMKCCAKEKQTAMALLRMQPSRGKRCYHKRITIYKKRHFFPILLVNFIKLIHGFHFVKDTVTRVHSVSFNSWFWHFNPVCSSSIEVMYFCISGKVALTKMGVKKNLKVHRKFLVLHLHSLT